MSAHTPGPWHVLPLQTGIAAEAQESGSFSIGNSVDENRAIILCSRFPWPERADEMKANAHLIAAAPDLIEALKDLKVRYEALFNVYSARAYCPSSDSSSDLELALTTCNRAIAKATGA
jgi:hypothetical protein